MTVFVINGSTVSVVRRPGALWLFAKCIETPMAKWVLGKGLVFENLALMPHEEDREELGLMCARYWGRVYGV